MEDNGPLVVSALGMLVVFGYYLYAWRRAGRDPSRGTIVHRWQIRRVPTSSGNMTGYSHLSVNVHLECSEEAR
jgi:hypothetical protein